MKMLAAIAAMGFLLGAVASDARAQGQGGDSEAGRALAVRVCAECHAVPADQKSPRHDAGAPDFRAIALTPGMTATSLTVFLSTPHKTMPEIMFSKNEMSDVIAYILSTRNTN